MQYAGQVLQVEIPSLSKILPSQIEELVVRPR
jgi:hypothetical protein